MMNSENLIAALQHALARDDTFPTGSKLYLAGSDAEAIYEASNVHTSAETLKIVEDAIRADSSLSVFDPGFMTDGSGNGSQISVRSIAQWLLAQCLKRTEPAPVVTEFAEFVAKNQATSMVVVPLTGIEIEAEHDLGDGIKLLPIGALPPSHQRDSFTGRDTRFGSMAGPRLAASSALIQSFFHSPVFTKASQGMPDLSASPGLQIIGRLQNVAICLSLVGPSGIIPLGHWSQLMAKGMPPMQGSAYGWNDRVSSFLFSRLSLPFDIATARKILTDFSKLNPNMRETLRVPLERFNQAIHQHLDVDAAIDLGISLESMLMHGEGGGEITFKIGFRGAWLSSDDIATRKRNMRLLRDVYWLRSQAIHAGKLEQQYKKMAPTRELLEKGLVLCSILLRRIIELDHFPDWDQLLSGGAA